MLRNIVGEAQRGNDGTQQEPAGSLSSWLRCGKFMEVRLLTERQEINVQNMNVELVAQMFKNYQSNVLFHLEGAYIVFWSSKLCTNVLTWQ